MTGAPPIGIHDLRPVALDGPGYLLSMSVEAELTPSDSHAELTTTLREDERQPPDFAATPEGRCGARLQGRQGDFCDEPPLKERTRCRLHGGATPVGRDSPNFRHGRDSRYPVPLDDEEQARYDAYQRAVYDRARADLAADLALARVQRDRAITAGGSGVAEAIQPPMTSVDE